MCSPRHSTDQVAIMILHVIFMLVLQLTPTLSRLHRPSSSSFGRLWYDPSPCWSRFTRPPMIARAQGTVHIMQVYE